MESKDLPDFFEKLPAVAGFNNVRYPGDFRPLPDSWMVISTDVEGSTRAVSEGRYRGVTMIGAACIIAARNAAPNVSLASSFGGDGATICAPVASSPAIIDALLALRDLAEKEHSLALRVGAVPVADLHGAGRELLVAKVISGGKMAQALFAGGGLSYAESSIKAANSPYLIKDLPQAPANLTGLECRWQDVRSSGETLSVIIEPLSKELSQQAALYAEVQQKLVDIFGNDAACNPIEPERLKLSHSPRKLLAEISIKHPQLSTTERYTRAIYLAFSSIIGSALLWLCEKLNLTLWSRYRLGVFQNSDFRKFADGFKLVLRSNPKQREQLQQYLQQLWLQGQAIFGTHVSPGTLITCLVVDRTENHFHFVDGDDGGLTMAAQDLKLRRSAPSSSVHNL